MSLGTGDVSVVATAGVVNDLGDLGPRLARRLGVLEHRLVSLVEQDVGGGSAVGVIGIARNLEQWVRFLSDVQRLVVWAAAEVRRAGAALVATCARHPEVSVAEVGARWHGLTPFERLDNLVTRVPIVQVSDAQRTLLTAEEDAGRGPIEEPV